MNEFIASAREASNQLVTNLHRAGELIQSFKQVAVDRSHADRRTFDLAEATEQIMSSLRPGISKRQLTLAVSCAPGIEMDSYPGAYGQVLTNLFLNAVTHAFKIKHQGTISIEVKTLADGYVQVTVSDDGDGMPDEVRRRAFDPFFTTLRGKGGTGLGLHIVHSIVTRQLGGRIILTTEIGAGSAFRMVLPLLAPAELVDQGMLMRNEG